ncbi:MAG: hypothetical protein J2P17_15510 [Mycobacterium sp.]|nr:hypothetical protein [Mycobacterium sp.]
MPPGGMALHDHLLRVLDRALNGTADRGEVDRLLEASEQIDQWREEKGMKLTASAQAVRNRSLDVMRRLAATLPENPGRAGSPDEKRVRPIEATTMTVEAFAYAIGKSSRTVYRMARQGQLSMYREGAGRGTLLIYSDQVDRVNRPAAAGDT